MTKKSSQIIVRMETHVLDDVRKEVERQNNRKNLSYWSRRVTISEWIRAAIQEKLKHAERGRKKRTPMTPVASDVMQNIDGV
jgi:protoheme ferro-lyase